MIGMILLAVLAVLIFFGLTDRYFAKMGVANWVAFLIVLAFAVAAVFPPLTLGTVSLSYAGFFLPVMLGAVAMFAIGANAGLLRAIVGALSVAGVTLAARVAFPPVSYTAAIASILIVGFAGGIVSYIIGQHRLAALASTLGGIVLGDFISAMLFRFAIGNTVMFELGLNGIFDSLVLSAIVGSVTLEVANVIIRAVERNSAATRSAPAPVLYNTEAAEDNDFDDEHKFLPIGDADDLIPPAEEDDIYDEYFHDDIKD